MQGWYLKLVRASSRDKIFISLWANAEQSIQATEFMVSDSIVSLSDNTITESNHSRFNRVEIAAAEFAIRK
jgi:hypothetical protein